MSQLLADDLDNVIDLLDGLNSFLRDKLETENKDRFTTLLDVRGNAYKPNSPQWIKKKGNNTPTTGITGNMRADLAVTESENVIRMISNMDYASYVQKEREFLGVTDEKLQSLLANYGLN